MTYIDESLERDQMLLARDPSSIQDEGLKRRYWNLREELDD